MNTDLFTYGGVSLTSTREFALRTDCRLTGAGLAAQSRFACCRLYAPCLSRYSRPTTGNRFRTAGPHAVRTPTVQPSIQAPAYSTPGDDPTHMNLAELVTFLTVTSCLGAVIALLLRFTVHGATGIPATALCGALIGPAAIAAVTTIWANVTRRDHIGN